MICSACLPGNQLQVSLFPRGGHCFYNVWVVIAGTQDFRGLRQFGWIYDGDNDTIALVRDDFSNKVDL